MASTIVIFGASGDLTRRKLLPSLYRLHCKGRLPGGTKIVGVSRSRFTSESWREALATSVAEFTGKDFSHDKWNTLAPSIHYHPGDITQADSFDSLANFLDELERDEPSERIYYLATAPRFYEPAIAGLGHSGLADEGHGPRRIVIEKPFGVDLQSAQSLNVAVHRVFDERQVFRIDHYLGKETVQNLAVLRFANTIFEPVWNRNYIDHVQITVAEEVAVGDRGDYYDTAGVMRDMFQNHLLQLLTITAMEPPVRFEADAIRNEKVKVLQAIRPMVPERVAKDTIRGQYQGYTNEEDVASDSQTATFAALKLSVDNWRWQNVPFYLRSGKAMSCRTTQIVIQFHKPPYMMFGDAAGSSDLGNQLVIQVQPAEGIQLHFLTKVPDAEMKLRVTDLDFRYEREFSGEMPDAYQRLLLDALDGDASLFARADEVELAWGIVDPVIASWGSSQKPQMGLYPSGFWGPEASTEWMHAQGRQWFDACPVLH